MGIQSKTPSCRKIFSGLYNYALMHREGLTLIARGSTLDYRRQILTTNVDPRTVRLKIFLIAVDP